METVAMGDLQGFVFLEQPLLLILRTFRELQRFVYLPEYTGMVFENFRWASFHDYTRTLWPFN